MELVLRELDRVTGGVNAPPALLKTADRLVLTVGPTAAVAGLATYYSVHHYLTDHVNRLLAAAHREGSKTP